MPMPKNKNEAAYRKTRALEMRCQGATIYRIAAELGITAPAVSMMLTKIERAS
jgi:predicted transcriptional regulator